MDEKTVARFWSKVDKHGPVPLHVPHLGPCWIWTTGRDRRGYGKFWAADKTYRAHRFAWLITNSETSLCVLHSCDNPICINPQHLFVGTQSDNVVDRQSKNRGAKNDTHGARLHPESRACGEKNGSRKHPEKLKRGEQNSRAKITAQDVQTIRCLAATGYTWRKLAAQFGLSHTVIGRIVHRKLWTHVA